MARIVCEAYGPPESLTLQATEPLVPRDGQVVVRVAAAGVNFVDALFVAGTYQIKIPPPFSPGSEFAGVVTAIGAGVDTVSVGDQVLASAGIGAWADEVAVPAAACTPVPASLTLPVAAALVQSYCTAWFSLTRRTTITPGQSVLVLGAGGGVGLAAIDVARSLGATVIAAASSPEKLAAATAMGADHTIAYETEDLKTQARELAGGGVDLVIDPVGGPHTEPALRATGVGGRLLVIGFAAGDIPRIPVNQVLLNNRSLIGVDWGAWALRNGPDQQALLAEVLAAVADGRLHPPAPTERPLAEAGAVLRDLLDRRLTGKVVLIPG